MKCIPSFLMLSRFCLKIQWKNRLINKSLYLKLVYIEFAIEVANNYRILLGMIEYFFRIIFIHVLQQYKQKNNANKKCNGAMRIKKRYGDGN